MSYDATNWAIKQRGLKPATKIVLWHLCDRYHPDHGCFPMQFRLAEDCEMSRSTLNLHLAELERRGLIKRVVRFEKGSHKQKSTLYLLRCNGDFPQYLDGPCPKTGHGKSAEIAPENEQNPCLENGQNHGQKPAKAVSEKQQKPCPKNGQSRVRNSDTNVVREPIREQVSISSSSVVSNLTPREEILIAAGYDKTGLTASGRIVGSAGEMVEVQRWRDDLGLSQSEILQIVGEVVVRKSDGPPGSLKYFTKAMQKYAAQKNQPKLHETEGGRHGRSGKSQQRINAFLRGARGSS